MRRVLYGAAVFLFLFSLAGCAELKQLRVETADQKTKIDQLSKDNQGLQDELSKNRNKLTVKQSELDSINKTLKTKEIELAKLDTDLKAKETELKTKESQLKELDAALKAKDVKVKEQSDAFTKMQEAMKAELNSKQVALKELEGKLTLTMVESILFDSGKADVKPEGIEALNKVAGVLRNTTDQEVVVAGFTDNVRIIGRLAKTYPTNWELSAARAISVVKILTGAGVDPKLLGVTGYSEYRPVAGNDTPDGRAKNRRMEIILMPKRN